MKRALFVVAAFALAACAKDLKPVDDPDAGMMPTSVFTIMDLGGGNTKVDVDAESHELWHYFDLETKAEVKPTSPDDSTEWDVAFQRYLIRTNSGISGTGNMGLAFEFDDPYDAVTAAPQGPYAIDGDDTERDEDTDPDYAFNTAHSASATGWYVYNATDHTLAPTVMTHVVRTVEGNYFKLEFTAYYSAVGNAGHPAFRFSEVDAPSNDGTIAVDVTSNKFEHVSIGQGAVVNISDPLTSLDWDVATDEAAWQTNSGDTRAGKGGARIAPDGVAWDAIDASPTIGFVTDSMIPFPGAPGSERFLGNPVLSDWFIYDAVNHTAASKGLIYFIRTAAGTYGKFQILDYDNPSKVYTVRVEALPREVNVESVMIDARPQLRWTYFSVRLGTTIEVMDEQTDETWDLGFNRTKIRTNSGTSGVGMGGAVAATGNTLAEITAIPGMGFEIDRLLPDPLSMGDEFSGNPVMMTALEVTGTATAAKDAAFVIRAADGTFAKLKITAYDDGMYSIDVAYAGPDQNAF